MHVSKITPETMADLWCALPKATRGECGEDIGAQHIMKGIHPILGAIVIADNDDDHVPGCGYLLMSEWPISALSFQCATEKAHA